MQHGLAGGSPLRLSRVIEALCADTRCSNLTAAYFFHSTGISRPLHTALRVSTKSL